MKGALSMIHHIVNDEGGNQANGNVSPVLNGDSGIGLDNKHSACKAFKEFEVIIHFKRKSMKRTKRRKCMIVEMKNFLISSIFYEYSTVVADFVFSTQPPWAFLPCPP
jgi:hypothetical protein